MSYLGPKGYTIYKDSISPDDLKTLKDELTVKPYVPKSPIQPPSFPIYRENANKIYALATENGLRSIGTFIGAFTFMYLTLPMLLNKSVNFWIMCVLVLYMVSDFFVRRVNNRSSLPVDTFVNFIAGAGTAIGAVFFMTGLKIDQHLMFNETSSNKVMCSVPKKQTFKCAVYKNGELIGSA